MICPAMVTFREDRDGVDMTEPQSGLELLLREFTADAADLFACVEVEMDLSEIHDVALSVVRIFRYRHKIVPCDLDIV